MTTITFQEDIKIDKFEFKGLADFRDYLKNCLFSVNLEKMDESEITSEIRKKMDETKKLSASYFTNI